MNKDAAILVAGGSGLVGSAIVRGLLAKGYSNVVNAYYGRKPYEHDEVPAYEADMTSQVEVEKLFSEVGPEYVFLAAARVGGILANSTYKAEFIYQNIMIAANVIDASYRHGVKKLLNLGSSCIYPRLSPQPMKEEYLLTGELEPTNEPYAIAKISAIKLCRYYNEQYGANFISVMPTNMYGPGDNYDLMNSHVLPALIRKFHLGKLLIEGDYQGIKNDFLAKGNSAVRSDNARLIIDHDSDVQSVMNLLHFFGVDRSDDGNVTVTLWGTGSPYREFLYADDLADAVIFLMDSHDYSDIGEFVNIGAGREATIREMAHIVANVTGYRGAIAFDSARPDGTPRKLLDVSRMSSLGWKAKTPLHEGIRRAYDWYLAG